MSTELAVRSRSGQVVRRALRLVDLATAPHGLDRYVELVAPTWSRSEVRGRVVGAIRRAPNTVTLTIRPNGRWAGFQAGQHTLLTVEIAGVRHLRCYSLANSAHCADSAIELTIKAHDGGTVSRYLVDSARPGLVVGLSPARGAFVLPDPRPDKLVLISGGSGITPVLSMLRTLIDEQHRGLVTFVHYARTATDNPYRDELRAVPPNVAVVNITTQPDRHHFTSHDLPALDAGTEVFVCGPAALRDAVRSHLTAVSHPDRYHDEVFSTPDRAQRTDATVTFCSSGLTAADDGRSLLRQAQTAGLSPKHGCGMGICHTCTATLRAGAVRNLITGKLTERRPDGQPVPIQICINGPVGDVAVDL